MHIAYILQSKNYQSKIYKGYTTNLELRLVRHNKGLVSSTKRHRPWKIIFYCVFDDKKKAIDFEKYLKSGSGIAFMRKRLIYPLR
ncbi:GIY-YIG nuclease family protein [Patescibacteria group bacterium]